LTRFNLAWVRGPFAAGISRKVDQAIIIIIHSVAALWELFWIGFIIVDRRGAAHIKWPVSNPITIIIHTVKTGCYDLGVILSRIVCSGTTWVGRIIDPAIAVVIPSVLTPRHSVIIPFAIIANARTARIEWKIGFTVAIVI
jgi:hypothetical protein